MRSWWRKSSKDVKRKSSKYVKQKSSRECIFGLLHRTCIRPGSPRRRRSDIASDRKTQSSEDSRSPSPSKQVSRCLSFGERPQAQPLPLPGCEFSSINRAVPENVASTEPSLDRVLRTSVFLPLPKPERVKSGLVIDGEGDLATGSNSSDSSSDTDDPSDSRLLSPQASDCENAIISATTNPSAEKQKDQFPFVIRKTTREDMKPANNVLMSRTPASPKQRPLNSHVTYLQMPHQSTFLTAPDSSMSSPSRSPIRVVGHEPLTSTGFSLGKPYADVSGSGHCSSPGSGYNSGHNSVAGDTSFQILWPQSRCSPECSPLTSPRMTSPGPCSRMHSGAVTPLHPRVGGLSTESPTSRLDDGKQQSHRLPLPPVTISNPSSFNPAPYSTGTSPRISRSPGRADNPSNPGARWKKGRLLGRGTFGHVYLGFSSETGEMCAMKEVTLFANDAKSRECAQQLGQEIALLSRLHHPNIVQYYGSETIDDKLYIYLEYVSGGSIYKILQDYGQLGEAAIRSYTRQILSGLAYLHTKNTIHRDIKGANILVEPNGRVKLADFGMAKHITGPSCPLSFKGSPYWMAPEVIRNSNGCNLAVDIWSLGCTVLEMATTKPPWSQYEGVAALFKIGNSRELPVIPDHLSDEGKDFVRQCLQRNPFNRPTAAQLLEHPFVNNVALLERPFLGTEHTHAMPAMTHAVRMLGLGHSKTLPCLNSLGALHHSKSSTSDPRFSDAYTARNISCPISPVRIPLPQLLSPKNVSGRLSPSSASSPQATSGASTPLRIGNRALTSCHRKNFVNEGTGMVSRSRTTSHLNANDREEHKPDIFRGIVQAHLLMEKRERSCKLGSKIEPPVIGDQKEQVCNSPLILADRVSRQLLRNPVRLNPVLDLNLNSPIPRRTNGN